MLLFACWNQEQLQLEISSLITFKSSDSNQTKERAIRSLRVHTDTRSYPIMMRQRGYTVLQSSTTVQDEYEPQPQQHHHQQQEQLHNQQPPQKFRTRSLQQDLPQDDADIAAGSRLQQQERQQLQQQQRPALMKSLSAIHPSSPTTRLYQSSNNNLKHETIRSMNSSVNDHSIIPNVDSYATLDTSYTVETAPSSACTINSVKGNTGDLEFFEDMITEPVMVLGIDISHLSKATQFTVCAAGLFFFSLLYGYLQELLSVTLCSRQLGLFLATTQFAGYTVLAYIMRNFVYRQQQNFKQKVIDQHAIQYGSDHMGGYEKSSKMFDSKYVPLTLYLGLSVLRAIDLAMVCIVIACSRHFFRIFPRLETHTV